MAKVIEGFYIEVDGTRSTRWDPKTFIPARLLLSLLVLTVSPPGGVILDTACPIAEGQAGLAQLDAVLVWLHRARAQLQEGDFGEAPSLEVCVADIEDELNKQLFRGPGNSGGAP